MKYRALFLAVLVWLIVAAWRSEANPAGLSPAHVTRLQRGEIVVLDVLPPGGPDKSVQGGTGFALVQARPQAVWRVLTDYPRHRGLYPNVVGAEVLESDAAHALVRYVVDVGPFSFGFHVDNWADATRGRIDWRLAHERPNGLFRDSWGYWQLEPRDDGVLLTYAMAARTVLPAFMTRRAERDGLVETLKAVRERAEHRS
jgi:ribosome-associated toxin RatA of RatAB toxin-antitoxin module